MDRLTVQQLIERLGEKLALEISTAPPPTGPDVVTSDVFRPGLLLAGFEQGFNADAIQVLGQPELAYLESLEELAKAEALARLCVPSVPCVIVTDGGPAPKELIATANASGTAVYVTPMAASTLGRRLAAGLDNLLAPQATLHGTLVDVYGVGLLFTGKSGIGKSECGLDLVEHGHRLVADDVVHVTRAPQGHLIGSGNDLLRHYMEIRGVGIIDVQAMFGIRAIRKQKRIEVEVKLVSWSDLEDYERLGFEENRIEILGVGIPLVTLPLVSGKNITVISEVIALNHLLKLHGVHAAREFDSRLRGLTSRVPESADLDRGDTE